MQVFKQIRKTVFAAGALALALGAVGCSTQQASHLEEPTPGVSLNTIASADPQFVAPPFSLVAADSIGLATFGQQIVRDDVRGIDGAFAEAN